MQYMIEFLELFSCNRKIKFLICCQGIVYYIYYVICIKSDYNFDIWKF